MKLDSLISLLTEITNVTDYEVEFEDKKLILKDNDMKITIENNK